MICGIPFDFGKLINRTWGAKSFLFTKILIHTFPDADIFKGSAWEIGGIKEYARELDPTNYELLEALPEYYSRCKGHPK